MISSNQHSQNEFLSFIISAKRLSSFSSYHQITELNLSNLQLTKIDLFPFEHFPKLHSLDLSYNQLISINPDWSKSSKNSIEYLNLSHNKLQTLLFLKDLKYLKTLNITENLLNNNERFLSLYLCSTIEHLIDSDQEQIHDDQLKLDRLLQLIETIWVSSYEEKYKQELNNNQIIEKLLDDFRQSMIEKQENISQLYLSPLGNYVIENKIHELCSLSNRIQSKSSFQTYLTDDFHFSIDINETFFQPIKFLHSHHQSNDDLTTVAIRMCAFEPNTSNNILATCGGQKVCFIDCDTCEITHIFEVTTLRSIVIPTGRKMKEKNGRKSIEHFSCLCWIEIEDKNENLKILAVGATNGHIYLLAPKWKLMFGHIELPASSISCLTWHSNNSWTLAIGSYHTVRLINIQSYINRLQSFIRKQNNRISQFDYDDSSMFINKVSTTNLYNLDGGDGPLVIITDLLFCPQSKDHTLLLVGTTSGLFVIRYQEKEEQTPIQIAFPKSLWTISEHIQSLRLINNQTDLIAMHILGLDQICCFDLKQSLKDQHLHISLSLPNPSQQIATKMAIFSTNHEHTDGSFECIIGSDNGSIFYHQIRSKSTKKATFEHKQFEISWPQMEISTPPNILSASINEHYLCLTTNNNLICIYRRQ